MQVVQPLAELLHFGQLFISEAVCGRAQLFPGLGHLLLRGPLHDCQGSAAGGLIQRGRCWEWQRALVQQRASCRRPAEVEDCDEVQASWQVGQGRGQGALEALSSGDQHAAQEVQQLPQRGCC